MKNQLLLCFVPLVVIQKWRFSHKLLEQQSLQRSSDFHTFGNTQKSHFLLLKTFVSIRCCFLWVHFPQDSFKCQTDLCATPQGLHSHIISRISWCGFLFILFAMHLFYFYTIILEIPLINSNYLLKGRYKYRYKYSWSFSSWFCSLFPLLRSAEPVLLCLSSITNMNWSVHEDAAAVPDVGCTQLLASLLLYILKLSSWRRWKWMGCVMHYLPLSIRQCKEPDLNKKRCFLMGANIFFVLLGTCLICVQTVNKGFLNPAFTAWKNPSSKPSTVKVPLVLKRQEYNTV